MEQKKSGRSIWLWLGIGGGVFVLFFGAIFWMAWMISGSSGQDDGFRAFGGGNIAVVDIDGVILSAEDTENDLHKFADDDSVKAIILHVNSPGGGAAASQEIYQEVLEIRQKHKKPIVVSIESVGASGAYYIASAADKIYANNASVVGSIGVIAEWVNYGELMKWAKLKEVMFKAGELKDAGTPTRDPTPAEAAYLQSLIDNMHQQFIDDVAKGRNMPVNSIASIASGRVWTGQQALPLHLIDKVGTFRDCLMDTAASVGIKGEPNVVRPVKPRRGLLDVVTGDTDLSILNPAKMVSKAMEENPGFYFLWK
jgi:protease-4